MDFRLIFVDLVRGRTHFEKRDQGKLLFSLDAGPKAEGRIALAEAAVGVGALGVATLALDCWRRKK
jgi:hypothetical protein